jgi:hypothetical protein
MKYPTIPYPRERDQVIMELALDRASSPSEIASINRYQGMLQCIFLSDVVTADGRYLECFVFDPGPFRRRSSYHFPRESPSQKDWETWFEFWHSYVLTGDKLAVPLGKWINLMHRKWLWYTSPKEGLIRIEDGYVHHYLPSQGMRRTRSTPVFTLAWRERLRQDIITGLPVPVCDLNEMHVNRLGTGPTMARGPQQPSEFWDFLRSWGGEWMWEGVDDCQTTKHDLSWLVQGMEMHSLIWVTDGLYDRKQAPTISGVGWIIFCCTSGK